MHAQSLTDGTTPRGVGAYRLHQRLPLWCPFCAPAARCRFSPEAIEQAAARRRPRFQVREIQSAALLTSWFYENYPDVFNEVFNVNAPLLLDPEWIASNNGGNRTANNAGLIRFRWLREGLAQILSQRRFWGFQLAQFVQGKVNPALKAHSENGLQLELTLATMIGIANSYGATGMRTKFLQPALEAFPVSGQLDPGTRELDLVQHMLRAYAEREVSEHPATQKLLAVFSSGDVGALPSVGSLAHRGARVLATLRMFPLSPEVEFTTLGTFRLDEESRFAGDPTTA